MLNWADNWYIEGSKAWYIHAEQTNVLFEYDFITQIATPLVKLPDFGENGFRRYANLFKVNNKIYCLPDLAKDILIYDLDNRAISYIYIENENRVRVSIYNYSQLNENTYILFSVGFQKYFILDVDENCIRKEISIEDTDIYDKFVLKNGKVYAKSCSGKNFISIDLEHDVQKIYPLDNISSCNTIAYDGSYFWMTGDQRELYRWKEGGEVISLSMPERVKVCKNISQENEKWYFRKIYAYENKIVGIPYLANSIIIYDKVVDEFCVIDSDDGMGRFCELFDLRMNSLFTPIYVREGRYVGFCELKKHRQYEIDMKDNKICEVRVKFDVNTISKVMDKTQMEESHCFDIGDFISYLKLE